MHIVLASHIDGRAQETLRTHHELTDAVGDFGAHRADLLADCHVLIFRSGVQITRELLDRAPHLSLVVRAGSGFDNIDLEHARARNIRVVRIPGPSADAVAEFTVGLMLALSRNIVRADSLLRRGRWPKSQLGGNLLGGKVLGIVGAGNIGSRVGQLASAWDMQVLGCVAEADQPWDAPPGIHECPLDAMLPQADYLTVHTPLMEETRHLIGARELAAMKASAYLINTARGGVVDEEALYQALVSGHLAGAALDVHELEGHPVIPKLAELPNVVLTPHIGGMALESQHQIGQRAIELIDAHFDGRLDEEVTDQERLA